MILPDSNWNGCPELPRDAPPPLPQANAKLVAMKQMGRITLDALKPLVHELCDAVTFERKMLPKGQWSLIWDDESGDAAVVGVDESGEEQHWLVEDLLEFHIYQDPSGVIYRVASSTGSQENWDSVRNKHKTCTGSLQVAGQRSQRQ